ncbi:MAG TPA: TonB-dependent receptor [Polyangiaceae bacterium]|nr:TonB-dependent receptor [Polyangiaceae bacterium]
MTRGAFLAHVAIAALLLAATAHAGDTSEIESLLDENVVTTASATTERASVAPATSVTITAEDLRAYGVRSFADAIQFLGLGVVVSDPLRTPDVGARGVLLENDDGKHFLLLVNGHAINDALYGAARFDAGAGVPLELVDHLEIIVGPGSVLYGSNAMMGVVNVITKRARDYSGGHVYGDFEPGRSYRAGAGAGVSFRLFGASSELTSAVEHYERFGPDLDFAPQQFVQRAPSAFRRGGPADGVWGGTARDAYFAQAESGVLRLRSGDFEVNLLASSYRRGLPYSTETTNVDFDDADSWERDHAVRLDVRHEGTLSSVVALSSRAYADAFGYQRRLDAPSSLACLRSDMTTCTYHDVGRSRTIGLEERLSLNWLRDGRLVTMLGVDVRENWAQAKEDALDFDTGQPFAPTAGLLDAHGSIVSPYAQQTYHPVTWLDVNAGARLDVDSRFSPVLSPRGALALHPGRTTTFKASYSEAFRAPTWSETSLANYRIAPAAGLRPERVRSIEGSVEQRFGTQRVLAGVFRSAWSDLVALEPLSAASQIELQNEGKLPLFTPPGIAQFGNVGSIENYGIDASFEGSVAEGRVRYGVNATEAYTRRTTGADRMPLPVAPELFGNARIAYAPGGVLPTLALAATYLGKRAADRPLTPLAAVPVVGPLAEFRLTITGAVPHVPGVWYRASAALAAPATSAYTAGPNLALANGGASTNAPPPLGFAPVDRASAFVGLGWDFGGGQGK